MRPGDGRQNPARPAIQRVRRASLPDFGGKDPPQAGPDIPDKKHRPGGPAVVERRNAIRPVRMKATPKNEAGRREGFGEMRQLHSRAPNLSKTVARRYNIEI
jgi:hypothetical protein